MPYREYRPIDIKEKLDLDKLNQNHLTLNELWENFKLEGHRCIKVEDFILLKDRFVEQQSIISVNTPKKINKQTDIDFPTDIQKEIDEIKDKYKLTKKDLKFIRKILQKSETKQMELGERINFIQSKASQIKNKRDLDKIMKDFIKNYSGFNGCLNEELKKLDDEERNEVKTLLRDIVRTIEDLESIL